MHVALCTQQFGNYWSGLGNYATLLARGLSQKGVRLTIITPGTPLENIAADYIHVEPSKLDKTHGGWFSLARAYRRALADLDADVIHFTDARESYGYQAHTPAIGTLHDDYFARHGWSPFHYLKDYQDWIVRYAYYSFVTCTERRALSQLSGLISNSRATAETIQARYGIDPQRVRTIYIEPELTDHPVGSDREKERLTAPKLLFVGGNVQRKGLRTVFEALKQLQTQFPDLKLQVLGKNQNITRLSRLSHKMGLADSVVFEGWVPPEQVGEHYSAASIFVMPSLMEGYGLVFLEAMAYAVPVIGSNVGGIRELIQHEQNGLLVEPRDADRLAEQIRRLLLDTDLRQKLISAGTQTVKQLSTERMIEETLSFYDTVRGNHEHE